MSETETTEADVSAPIVEAAPIAWAPASKEEAIAFVQILIDASFVRYEMQHGHLSADDGAQALAALHAKFVAID